MTLRRRLALTAALAVALAAVLVALISYMVVRGQLRGQVDDALYAQAALVRRHPEALLQSHDVPTLPEREGGPARFVQIVLPDGSAIALGVSVPLPIDAAARRLATAGTGEQILDTHLGRLHVRLLTAALPGGGAVQFARSLAGVDDALAGLRTVLIALAAASVALAAGLGALAARRIIAPIVRLSRAARRIGETDDLSERIQVQGHDEVAELARRFNAMLAALEGSRRAQRRLVADASHELRTPVTSLRTNIEVLLDDAELSEATRRRVLNDALAQAEELSDLVSDLMELAREEGAGATPARDEVRLDELAAEAMARARRHAPGVPIEAALEPAVVLGDPARLARALNNLLDNAARHTPPGTAVQVAVDADGVAVRDRGPGVPDAELPHLFDRFYRGADARSRPGSGLGLAIVRQVAEAHGGSAEAANAPDGGAVFRVRLPVRLLGHHKPRERSLAGADDGA